MSAASSCRQEVRTVDGHARSVLLAWFAHECFQHGHQIRPATLGGELGSFGDHGTGGTDQELSRVRHLRERHRHP